jgi:hypothetical protein
MVGEVCRGVRCGLCIPELLVPSCRSAVVPARGTTSTATCCSCHYKVIASKATTEVLWTCLPDYAHCAAHEEGEPQPRGDVGVRRIVGTGTAGTEAVHQIQEHLNTPGEKMRTSAMMGGCDMYYGPTCAASSAPSFPAAAEMP